VKDTNYKTVDLHVLAAAALTSSMNRYSDSTWSQSFSTLATVDARDGDDEATISGPRRFTGAHTLVMTPDDVRNTSFYGSNGSVLYSVTSTPVNGGKSLQTEVKDFEDNIIGLYTVSKSSETIVLGNSPPIKRKAWLATGGLLSDKVTRFDHEGVTYKWKCKESNNRDFTMELRSGNPTHINPIARFTSSRRDWTAPSNQLYVKSATFEFSEDGALIRDICIFSFIVAEKIREEGKPWAHNFDLQEHSARGTESGYRGLNV